MPPDPFGMAFNMNHHHHMMNLMKIIEAKKKFETMTDEECVADALAVIKDNKDNFNFLECKAKDLREAKNEIKCQEMKERGNKAFIQNDMKKALSFFNEAILVAPWNESKFSLSFTYTKNFCSILYDSSILEHFDDVYTE